jgi:hypothetical protein
MEVEHRQQQWVWNKPGGSSSGSNKQASLDLIADSRKLTALNIWRSNIRHKNSVTDDYA